MIEYTEEVHVSGLVAILERFNTCEICPSNYHEKKFNGWFNYDLRCYVCWEFLGYAPFIIRKFPEIECDCPCEVLGKEKAAKLTWLALEEKGYI